MKCLNCGNQLPEGTQFCGDCGQKVVKEEVKYTPKFCSQCGNSIGEGTEFCTECGNNVVPKREIQEPQKIVELQKGNEPAVVSSPHGAQDGSVSPAPPKQKKSSNKKFIIIGTLVAIIAIGIFAYNYITNSMAYIIKNTADSINEEVTDAIEENEIIENAIYTLSDDFSGNYIDLYEEEPLFYTEYSKKNNELLISEFNGNDSVTFNNMPFSFNGEELEVDSKLSEKLEDLNATYAKELIALLDESEVSNSKSKDSQYDREIVLEVPTKELIDLNNDRADEYMEVLTESFDDSDFKVTVEAEEYMVSELIEEESNEFIIENDARSRDTFTVMLKTLDKKIAYVEIEREDGYYFVLSTDNVDSYLQTEYEIEDNYNNAQLNIDINSNRWNIELDEDGYSYGIDWYLDEEESDFEIYDGDYIEQATIKSTRKDGININSEYEFDLSIQRNE